MSDEIKSAIDHYRDVCVQMGQYPESDTYRYAELAIRSLQAWSEVLQELEERLEWLHDHTLNFEDDFYQGRVIELKRAINIINKHLAEIERE